ncbi:hypothetical protein KC960_03190 [Candidatus Saccharibacteria bacterium]|nr:hypothetical protein [Candidatus Saccharibacteria bacterium]
MKINAKQFFWVMIGVLVLSFGGIFAAFYWGNNLLVDKAHSISELQTDSDIAQQKIIALHNAINSGELADQAKDLISKLLPPKKDQEKLVADIYYTVTKEANIPIGNIGALTFTGSGEPSDLSGTVELKDIPGVYSYPFSMSVSDISYDTLLLLLSELENNDRLIQVENLQISPDKTTGYIKSVNLSLKAFLMP